MSLILVGSAAHSQLALASNAAAALVWWLVPLFGVSGAIIYVVWVSKFQDKYENETNRSVNKFQSFQDTFRVAPSSTLEEDRDRNS
jgi:hypothetical protein